MNFFSFTSGDVYRKCSRLYFEKKAVAYSSVSAVTTLIPFLPRALVAISACQLLANVIMHTIILILV